MKTVTFSRAVLAGGTFLAVVLAGCLAGDNAGKQTPATQSKAKKVEVGKNVVLEIEGDRRRVLVQAAVCLRQGQLEQFLTRKRTKEHEAILAADIDARDVHTALTLARAEPGHPVRFQPKFAPPSGTAIEVSVEYKDKDKVVRVPAQQWIRSAKTKKDLQYSWVFAGSVLFPDPFDNTRKPYYAANDGDVICVANFDTAMLDLPIISSKDNDDLAFEAHTERIPALDTPVLVILEPVLDKKKK